MAHYDSCREGYCPECKQIGGIHSNGCPNDTKRKLDLHECECDLPSCIWVGPAKDCPPRGRKNMGMTNQKCSACVRSNTCTRTERMDNGCEHFGHGSILRELFRRQAELNERVGYRYIPGDPQHMGTWLNNYIDAMIGELCELRDCTYWKHWYKEARQGRRYELHNPEHAKVEVVDILHFWISLAQCLGLTAEDVFDLYCRKMEKNHKRQDDDCTTEEAKGYDL